jgi:hypothetical protein
MTDAPRPWRASGTRIADLGFNAKGIGGLQTRRLRALRAGKFGAAGKPRRLTIGECTAVESQMRREGRLS